MEALLDCEKAAELLGISPWTVRKWLSTNKLRSVRLGRRVLIESTQLCPNRSLNARLRSRRNGLRSRKFLSKHLALKPTTPICRV